MSDEASSWLQYARENLQVAQMALQAGLTEDDSELLDSIYVCSKYPLDSVLPESPPDPAVCQRCVELARDVLAKAENATKE